MFVPTIRAINFKSKPVLRGRKAPIWCSLLLTALIPLQTQAIDNDNDGIEDSADNCSEIANADQRDTDNDSYGNRCDPDINNNGFTDAQDFAKIKLCFENFSSEADCDLNGNGFTDAQDIAITKLFFEGFLPPGPAASPPAGPDPSPPAGPDPSPPVDNSGTFYLAPNGNDLNPGTESAPWASLQHAANSLEPGETVLLMDGVYDPGTEGIWSTVEFLNSGRPDAYITFRAYPGHRPKIISRVWNAIHISNAAYIRIEGLELQGVTDPNDGYHGLGITVDDNSHHIQLIDNEVHHFERHGIVAMRSDYLLIEGNIVHHNAIPSTSGDSGITIFQPENFDNAPGFHTIIRGNIGYKNENTIAWSPQGIISDGNCILSDSARHASYTAATLVENNLCFGNGGRGIGIFQSDNFVIRNNTFYQNTQSWNENIYGGQYHFGSEIDIAQSDNIQIYNNIAVPRANHRALGVWEGTQVTSSNNLYDGPNDLVGSDDIVGEDPQFVRPSLNPEQADFSLQSESPAINQALSSQTPEVDIEQTPRSQDNSLDAGAYEFTP